jgi:hypothetical protein
MTRLVRGLSAALLLAAVGGVALVAQSAKPAGPAMADAAAKFLATLPAELRSKTTFPFDSEQRTKWHFVPQQDANKQPTRKGVRMEELTDGQKAAALALLKSGLSAKGFEQATSIMNLERLLAELEPNGQNVRNPNWYFVSVFGEPSATGKWGWRVEGHHLSVNVTLDRGEVISSGPTVFASNPAEVKDGVKKGLRVIGETEDLAKVLIDSLTDDQKKVARQAKQFPEVGVATRVDVKDPVGLPASKMTDAQNESLMKLVAAYANRMTPESAEAELKKVKDAGVGSIHFAYALEENKPGKPYTYRVHGPTFVVEFLNVQADSARNPANHIHSAWRKLPADFGLPR